MLSKILEKVFKGNSKEQVPVATKNEMKVKKSNITPTRIGELGEYKINIQFDQLPKNSKYGSGAKISADLKLISKSWTY